MQVKQFRYGIDNFSYLVYGHATAVVIDGGAVENILEFVQERSLSIECITNTHGHGDHTVGNKTLLERTQAPWVDHKRLSEKEGFETKEGKLRVYRTPGHTPDSVCFGVGDTLITGDTLFNGTIGNCFSGDLKGFLASIKKLMAFPGKMRIYAGHDYVRDSVTFAGFVEPGNPEIDLFWQAYDPNHVYSTLAQELRINPYLRFNEKSVVKFLKNKGLPVDTEYERWQSLMSIE